MPLIYRMGFLPFIPLLAIAVAFTSSFASAGPPRFSPDAPSPKAKLSLRSCRLPNGEGEARCGNYAVFENRAAKAGRKISLHIVVLPALNATPAPDPVFWLHGGPGVGATQAIEAAKGGFLAGLRKNRDLVFVDQRGTGRSNGLTCDLTDDPADLQSFFGELFPPDKVRACRERLEKVADLALYTTPVAMDDLDEVRAALGYDRINLVAGSYGTIAAQVYMRQHPDHLRAVFMVGVATPSLRQPLPFAKGAQEALDRLFEDCAADETCRRAFPHLPNELAAVLARFDKGPVEAELINPSTKQKQSVKITRSNFVERLRLMLYTTTLGRFVPLVIHKASENDYLPFEALAIQSNLGRLFARGMYFTVTCSEGIPFITEEDIVKETKGTFVGDGRVRFHREACKEWPQAKLPRSYIAPVESEVPVLMISGELDASTPVWLGEGVVAHLQNGRQVKIRYYGHQLDDPCVWHILWEFIEKGSAKGIDTTCTDKIRRPPFALELPKPFSL